MRFVTYARVSTIGQKISGLGLEAQQKMMMDYVQANAGKIAHSFVEVESGSNSSRPQLKLAISRAKAIKGVLLLSTLDRLGRRVALIANLMESGVKFVCADSPNSSPFELHIRASMAEEEKRKISERTTLALKAAKARGVKLGSPVAATTIKAVQAKGSAAAAILRKEQAKLAYEHLLPTMKELRQQGQSLKQIAQHLNEGEHTTSRGLPFTDVAVMRILAR